ncbi:hypothetical protein BBJ28_00027116, partial [Nothophytophthora sp. Chile5]
YKATVAIALVPHPFVAWRSLAVLHVARPRVFGGALKVPLDPQFWNVGLPAASLKDAIQCRFSVQHGAEKKRVRFRAPCRFIYDDWVRCLREHMAPPSLAWLHYPDTPRESLAMMESPASARDMAILDNISYTSSSDWIETAGTVATAETDGDSENVEHETDDAVLAGIDRASSTQGVCNTVAEVGSTSAEPGCDIECVCGCCFLVDDADCESEAGGHFMDADCDWDCDCGFCCEYDEGEGEGETMTLYDEGEDDDTGDASASSTFFATSDSDSDCDCGFCCEYDEDEDKGEDDDTGDASASYTITQGAYNTVAEVGSTSAEPGCDIECVCGCCGEVDGTSFRPCDCGIICTCSNILAGEQLEEVAGDHALGANVPATQCACDVECSCGLFEDVDVQVANIDTSATQWNCRITSSSDRSVDDTELEGTDGELETHDAPSMHYCGGIVGHGNNCDDGGRLETAGEGVFTLGDCQTACVCLHLDDSNALEASGDGSSARSGDIGSSGHNQAPDTLASTTWTTQEEGEAAMLERVRAWHTSGDELDSVSEWPVLALPTAIDSQDFNMDADGVAPQPPARSSNGSTTAISTSTDDNRHATDTLASTTWTTQEEGEAAMLERV